MEVLGAAVRMCPLQRGLSPITVSMLLRHTCGVSKGAWDVAPEEASTN